MQPNQNIQQGNKRWSLSWLSSGIKKLWNYEHTTKVQKPIQQKTISKQQQTVGKKEKQEQVYQLEDQKTRVLNKIRNKKFKNKSHFQDKIKRVNKYFNRKQNQLKKQYQQKQYQDEDKFKSPDLECAICLYFFVKPVTTVCGHSFCIRCLDQNLLIKTQCPTCRNFLRGTKLIQCQSLQNLSLREIEKYSTQQITYYNQTLKQTVQWLQRRSLDLQKLEVNDKIDVKDTQYIWCKAQIKQIYRKDNQVESLLVHYLGWNCIYDEIIDINSDRLASCGFYTERNNIPHYRSDQNGQRMYSYVITNQQQFNMILNPNPNPIIPNPNPNPLNLQMLNNIILQNINMNQQQFQLRSLQVIFEQSIESQELNLSVHSNDHSHNYSYNYSHSHNENEQQNQYQHQFDNNMVNHQNSINFNQNFSNGVQLVSQGANNFSFGGNNQQHQHEDFSFGGYYQQQQNNHIYDDNHHHIIDLIQSFQEELEQHRITLYKSIKHCEKQHKQQQKQQQTQNKFIKNPEDCPVAYQYQNQNYNQKNQHINNQVYDFGLETLDNIEFITSINKIQNDQQDQIHSQSLI